MTELPNSRLETWYDFASMHDGMFGYAFCHRFPTGRVVREDRSPVSAGSPELIYIARRGN